MRGSNSKFNPGAILGVLVLLLLVGVGLQFSGIEVDLSSPTETEHYNQSQEWCNSQNGSLIYLSDSFMAEHNGFHCSANGELYHMHRVADLNYTHDMDRVKNKCGTRHGNTPFFIGCNFSLLLLLPLMIVVLIATIPILNRS